MGLSNLVLYSNNLFVGKAPSIQEHDTLTSLNTATTVNNQTINGKQWRRGALDVFHSLD